MIYLSLIMQQTPEVMHTNCLSHVSIILAIKIFADRIIIVWYHLPPSVSFASLSAFRRTIQKVDFSQFMKCT